MKAVRIFTWVAIVLMGLHFLGPWMMMWLNQSHIVVKALFCIALVVIVEFGIWASATGPSDLIRRLQDNPQDAFQEIKSSF